MPSKKRVLLYDSLSAESTHIAELTRRSVEEAPERGRQHDTGSDYDADPRKFDEMLLSKRTLQGLTEGSFASMTRIQAAAIPHALAGRDLLGAAKTGSGKTLAFLVPILELLWREKWSALDGLGALVVAPTRELAIQIFDVLRSVGKHHTFSAGLLIGGKKEFNEEQRRVTTMAILVATPGRLLQHLEQTPGFDCGTMKVPFISILSLGAMEALPPLLHEPQPLKPIGLTTPIMPSRPASKPQRAGGRCWCWTKRTGS